MPDITVSADIDTFMGSADASAARGNIGTDAAGASRPPSAHTHLTSQISDASATGQSVLTAANAAAARTAIGTDAAGDTRPPTAHTHPALQISDSTVTGRSVLTASDAPAARSSLGLKFANNAIDSILYFDHFINGTTYRDGFTVATTGGSAAVQNPADTYGVIRLSTGNGASTLRRAVVGVTNNFSAFRAGMGALTYASRTRITSTPFDGTTQGKYIVGFIDSDLGSEPTDGCYFRSVNGGNWHAVVRQANVETVLDLGTLPIQNDWRVREVTINAAGTEVRFYVDNVLVAFFTSAAGVDSGINKYNVTTIPTAGYFSFGVGIVRDTSQAVAYTFDVDFILGHYAPTTPFNVNGS